MKRLGFALLLLCVALPARAASGLGEARPVTLPNGLRLLLAPDSTAAGVDLAVWYDAGLSHERPGITGITHLFEHLMFRGSEHVPAGDHQRRIAEAGGTVGASTTADFVCFHDTVPPEALALAMRLEADRMGHLKLDQARLDAQRAYVREEKRREAARAPAGQALAKLYSVTWAGHPYRWPVMGLDRDLDRITLQDCRDYYRERFAPNAALVTVVGDFDPARALELARDTFGALPRRGSAASRQAPEPRAGGRADGRTPLPVALLLMGWRTPPDADAGSPALEVLARLLGGDAGNLLQGELERADSTVLAAQAGVDSRRQGGLFYTLVAVKADADTAAVEREVAAAVERLAAGAPAAEAVARAERRTEAGMLFGWQTVRGRGQALGTAAMVDGDPGAAWARLERIRALTPSALQQAARKMLVPSGRSVVWLRPAPRSGGRP